jgi:hypothetical protein
MLPRIPKIAFILLIMSVFMVSAVYGQPGRPKMGRWPWTSKRLIQPDELVPLSSQNLRLMRNEIYARHGYVFQSQDLQDYFSNQRWYRPKANNDLAIAALTPVEKENIETIRSREQALVSGPDTQSASLGRWPETSIYVIRPDDLLHLSSQNLRLMRNEIYARHGYVFQDEIGKESCRGRV